MMIRRSEPYGTREVRSCSANEDKLPTPEENGLCG